MPNVDPKDIIRFRDLVRSRTGMAFPESRTSDFASAVGRATADVDARDAGALYAIGPQDLRPPREFGNAA